MAVEWTEGHVRRINPSSNRRTEVSCISWRERCWLSTAGRAPRVSNDERYPEDWGRTDETSQVMEVDLALSPSSTVTPVEQKVSFASPNCATLIFYTHFELIILIIYRSVMAMRINKKSHPWNAKPRNVLEGAPHRDLHAPCLKPICSWFCFFTRAHQFLQKHDALHRSKARRSS